MRGRGALFLLIATFPAVLLAVFLPARARAQDAGGTASGQDGAIRVVAASSPEPGSVRVVSGFEWLNEHGYIAAGHFHERTQSSTAIAWGATRWLEISAEVLATTNYDGSTRPFFITAIGDADGSARIGGTLFSIGSARVSAGVRGGAHVLQGDKQGPKQTIVNPYGYGLLSVEGEIWRLSLNAGYYADHSKELIDPAFKATPGQTYAYGVDAWNAAVGGVALDFPGARFSPLLEATVRDDLGGAPGKPAAVGTGGLRWSPGRGRVTVTAACDVGLSGTEVVPDRVRAPNWNIVGGLTFRLGSLRTAPPERATPASAPVPGLPPNMGVLRGHVAIEGSGAPLAGVVILLADGTSATTDANGKFEFPPMRRGPVKLAVRHDDYQGEGKTAFVSVGQATSLTFTLTRIPPPPPGKARLLGVVADDAGKPIAATITATSAGAKDVTTVADPDGHFRIDVPLGAWALAVTAPGFDAKNEVGMVSAEQDAPLDVRMTRTSGAPAVVPPAAAKAGVVSGKVTGSGGKPVVGALVSIRSAGKVRQVSTDAKGEFHAEVEGTDVDVAVSAIGYGTQTMKSRIVGDKPATVNVRLFRPGKAPR